MSHHHQVDTIIKRFLATTIVRFQVDTRRLTVQHDAEADHATHTSAIQLRLCRSHARIGCRLRSDDLILASSCKMMLLHLDIMCVVLDDLYTHQPSYCLYTS